MSKKRKPGSDFIDALPADGTRRLMLAVLIDAIRAMGSVTEPNAQLRTQRAWVRDRLWFVREDRSSPFSFVNICDALGLEAGYVRRCVLSSRPAPRPIRLRRYAARVEDTWRRQRYERPNLSRRPGTGTGRSEGDQQPASALAVD